MTDNGQVLDEVTRATNVNTQNIELISGMTKELQTFSSSMDQYSRYISMMFSKNIEKNRLSIKHNALFAVYIELNQHKLKTRSEIAQTILFSKNLATEIKLNELLNVRKLADLLMTNIHEDCQIRTSSNQVWCLRNSRISKINNFDITISSLSSKVEQTTAKFVSCLPTLDKKIFNYSNTFLIEFDNSYFLTQEGTRLLRSCLEDNQLPPCTPYFWDLDSVPEGYLLHDSLPIYYLSKGEMILLMSFEDLLVKTQQKEELSITTPTKFTKIDFPLLVGYNSKNVSIGYETFLGT